MKIGITTVETLKLKDDVPDLAFVFGIVVPLTEGSVDDVGVKSRLKISAFSQAMVEFLNFMQTPTNHIPFNAQ